MQDLAQLRLWKTTQWPEMRHELGLQGCTCNPGLLLLDIFFTIIISLPFCRATLGLGAFHLLYVAKHEDVGYAKMLHASGRQTGFLNWNEPSKFHFINQQRRRSTSVTSTVIHQTLQGAPCQFDHDPFDLAPSIDPSFCPGCYMHKSPKLSHETTLSNINWRFIPQGS